MITASGLTQAFIFAGGIAGALLILADSDDHPALSYLSAAGLLLAAAKTVVK